MVGGQKHSITDEGVKNVFGGVEKFSSANGVGVKPLNADIGGVLLILTSFRVRFRAICFQIRIKVLYDIIHILYTNYTNYKNYTIQCRIFPKILK